jgi:hypothetical protein
VIAEAWKHDAQSNLIETAAGEFVCDANGVNIGRRDIIVAAPSLLAACEAIDDAFGGLDDLSMFTDEQRAAIERVRGMLRGR